MQSNGKSRITIDDTKYVVTTIDTDSSQGHDDFATSAVNLLKEMTGMMALCSGEVRAMKRVPFTPLCLHFCLT